MRPYAKTPRISTLLPHPMLVVYSMAVILAMLLIGRVAGHGRMMDPPSRNSMWRLGFSNPVNYNDNELYCGGRVTQWARNKGRCGVCGDAYHAKREHEIGGKYANGIVTRDYLQGDVIDTTIHITANHRGYFEFRLCPVHDPELEVSQRCLDTNVLERADGGGTKYFLPEGKSNQFFNISLALPPEVTCERCVIQWKYRTGNTWDKNESGEFCVGCGPQEEFYNCADVSIHPRIPGTKWRRRSGKPTKIAPGVDTKLSPYGQKKAGFLSHRATNTGYSSSGAVFDGIVGVDKSVSEDTSSLADSISDYNKRMYSHLLEKQRKKNLAFGPTGVAFKWKAGQPKTVEINKIYRRFGYGDLREKRKDSNSATKKTDGRVMKEGSEYVSRAYDKLPLSPRFGGQRRDIPQWQPQSRSNYRLHGNHTRSLIHRDKSLVSWNERGSMSPNSQLFQTNRMVGYSSGSPFTPSPPDGDPDLLRIFPIHGRPEGHQPRYAFLQNALSSSSSAAKLVKDAPHSGFFYWTDKSHADHPVAPITHKYLPPRLITAAKTRNSTVGDTLRQRYDIRDRVTGQTAPTKNYGMKNPIKESTGDENVVNMLEDENCKYAISESDCLNRNYKTSSFLNLEQDDNQKDGQSSQIIEGWNNTFLLRNKESEDLLNDFVRKREFTRDESQTSLTGSTDDSAESLIHFLLSLLLGLSESEDLARMLNQADDVTPDVQASNVKKNENPESTGSFNFKDFYRPAESVYTQTSFSNYPTPISSRHSNAERSIFPWYKSEFLSKTTQSSKGMRGNKQSYRINKGRQQSKNQPEDRPGLYTTESYMPFNFDKSNRNEDSLSRRFQSRFGYSPRLRDSAYGELAKETWESRNAGRNKAAMREYRRAMGRRRGSQTPPVNNIKNWFRRRAQPLSSSAENLARASRYRLNQLAYNRHKSLQNMVTSSFKPVMPSDFLYSRHPTFPLYYSNPSEYRDAPLPLPHPISQPMTRTFSDIAATPAHPNRPQFERRKDWKNDTPSFRKTPSVSDNKSYQRFSVPYPRLSQFWDSALAMDSNPTVEAQTERPAMTNNLWQASTHLNPLYAFQSPTRSLEQRPKRTCKSLISLAGGMDQWCKDNCQANFCPPTTCICYTERDMMMVPKPTPEIVQEHYTSAIYHENHAKPYTIDHDARHGRGISSITLKDSDLPFHIPYDVDDIQTNGVPAKSHSPQTPSRNSMPKVSPYMAHNKMPSQRNAFSYKEHGYRFYRPQRFIQKSLGPEVNGNKINLESQYLNQRRSGILDESVSPISFNDAHAKETSTRNRFVSPNAGTNRYSKFVPERYERVKDNGVLGKVTGNVGTGQRLITSITDPFYKGREVEKTPPEQITSRTLSGSRCVAIGPYSGLDYFDEWCNVTCRQSMCPLLLCSCSEL